MDMAADLERRIETLEELVALQREQIRLLSQTMPSPNRGDLESDTAVGRRALLRTAGVAAGAAALSGLGLLASSEPAAAANGDALKMGETSTATAPTIAAASPITTTGFAFTDDVNFVPQLPAMGTPPPVVEVVSNTGKVALYAASSDTAIRGVGTYGVVAYGSRAPLLIGGGTYAAPTNDTNPHQAGEFLLETGGTAGVRLWFCVKDGTPGEWRMLASPATLSTFTPIPSQRLYDSRSGDGPLSHDQTRVVSLGAGVGALQINLTITDTVGTGYLSVFSNDLASVPGSSINWFTSHQIAANSVITEVDSQGLAKVFAGGGGSTHFIIDLVGWYG